MPPERLSPLFDQIQYFTIRPCFGPTDRSNIYNLIQVQIPQRKSRKSYVFKMKCANSNITHDVLISKEIRFKSYREICSGEKTKVNLGFNNLGQVLKVENNSVQPHPPQHFVHGHASQMSEDWEVLSVFFSLHNIEPNWLNCHFSWGSYNKDLGGWTGCMGKV